LLPSAPSGLLRFDVAITKWEYTPAVPPSEQVAAPVVGSLIP